MSGLTWSATVVAILLVHAQTASADRSPFETVAQTLREGKAELMYVTQETVDTCRQAVAADRKAGKPATDVLSSPDFEGIPKAFKDDNGFHLKLGDADELCKALDKFRIVVEARVAIEDVAKDLHMLDTVVDSQVTEFNLASFKKDVPTCRPALAVIKAHGATKLTLEVNGTTKSVAVADAAKYCDALDAGIPKFKALLDAKDAAEHAEWDKIAAPYKAVGIAGDKLDWLVGMQGRAVYGIGGKELTTPKQKAAASVMFEVLSGSDSSVTIRRNVFKGNAANGGGQKDYPSRPGASAFK